MDIFLDDTFFNPTKGQLTLPEVLNEMVGYIKEKPHGKYEVVVGCDSSPSEEPTFPVVIVMLRKGEGGRFFLKFFPVPPVSPQEKSPSGPQGWFP